MTSQILVALGQGDLESAALTVGQIPASQDAKAGPDYLELCLARVRFLLAAVWHLRHARAVRGHARSSCRQRLPHEPIESRLPRTRETRDRSVLTDFDVPAILMVMKTLRVVQKLNNCCRDDDASTRRRYPEHEEAARLFKALADETRLAILRQLRDEGEVCACDFQACCTLAQPTVSHHLKVLREAGLVTAEKRGLWVHYQLNPAKLERLHALLP